MPSPIRPASFATASPRPAAPPWRVFHGWKGLGRFWIGTVSLLGIGSVLLQLAGPPSRPGQAATVLAPRSVATTAPLADRAVMVPRVAILVSGIGMSMASSTAAIESLPPEITLAVSPYAPDPTQLIQPIKAHGHEYLLALPMEPEGHPLNDADATRALMASLPDEENIKRLQGFLTRISGYAGVTSVTGALRGDKFLADPEMFNAVMRMVTEKGLFLIDTGSHKPAPRNQPADVMLDEEPLDAAMLDERLDRLTRLAQEKGMALGVAGLPRPVVLDRIAAWARTLSAKGVALVPVSALIAAVPGQEAAR